MTAIFICTHGKAAVELLNSAEMICGEQKNVATTYFKIDESPDQLSERIEQTLTTLDQTDGTLCLTDLKGGTPFNVLVRLSTNKSRFKIVTGVNIPMLLNVLVMREQLKLDELTAEAVTTGTKSVYLYEPTQVKQEDEDF